MTTNPEVLRMAREMPEHIAGAAFMTARMWAARFLMDQGYDRNICPALAEHILRQPKKGSDNK